MTKKEQTIRDILAKIETLNGRERSLHSEWREIVLKREDLLEHLKEALNDEEEHSFDFLEKRLKSPDAIEEYLRKRNAPAKVSEITEGIRQMGLIDQNEDSVRSTLVRHNAKNHRFRRVGKNTYALIKEQEDKN